MNFEQLFMFYKFRVCCVCFIYIQVKELATLGDRKHPPIPIPKIPRIGPYSAKIRLRILDQYCDLHQHQNRMTCPQ